MNLTSFVNPFIYTVFLLGLFFVFREAFEMFIRKLKRKSDLKKQIENKYESNRFISYVDYMLMAVFPKKRIKGFKFITFSIVLFFVSFIALSPVMSLKAIFPAAFLAALPFLWLRFRLEKIRNSGSKEAEILVAGLLNFYRINHKNIFAAMEAFVKDKAEGCNITRNMIFQLLMDTRNTKNKDYIKRATERFAFGIKTNWSFMLSQCIFAAAYEGIDITESLEDILEQLKTARVLDEEKKRANSESTRLVQFLVPISYFASVAIAVFMLDIPLGKLIRNQLLEPAGMGILCVIVVLFIVNMTILDLVKNGKFDY